LPRADLPSPQMMLNPEFRDDQQTSITAVGPELHGFNEEPLLHMCSRAALMQPKYSLKPVM